MSIIKNKKSQSGIITIILIVLLVLVAIIIIWQVVKGLVEKKAAEIEIKPLLLDADIEYFNLIDDSTAEVKIKRGSSGGNITGIKLVFKDYDGNTYLYENKSSFPNELEIKVYIINNNSLNISDFLNIKEVSVHYIYETKADVERLTPKLDTEKRRPGGGGGNGGPSPPPCTPDCQGRICGMDPICGTLNCGSCESGFTCVDGDCHCINATGCIAEGIFCQDNQPYNCSLNETTGCLDRINMSECAINETCINGTGCVEILECTSNENCTYLNNICAYGICNLTTNSCEVMFNSSTDVCRVAAGECDVGEYCTGSSSICPVDVFEPDNAPCTLDAISCTDDVCISGFCDHVLNDSLCDDGLYCDGTETCDAILDCQVGIAPNCNDTVDCTEDICNEILDTCENIANNSLCDDGNECTDDSCDSLLGCVFVNLPAGTACSTGQCDGNGNCVECLNDSDCGTCQNCNASNECENITANNGNNCIDDCTYCSTGSCIDRNAHDWTECNQSCYACTNITGPADNCIADNYTEGFSCQDPGKYCDAGFCCIDT